MVLALTLLIDVRGMVNDVDTMFDTHSSRITSTSMGAEPFASLMRLIDTGGSLFIGIIAVRCRTSFTDLCLV